MLPKKIRLTTALFDQVFKTGKVQHSPLFWVRSILASAGLPSRFAVVVSKKIAPTAVLRNKNKRFVYKAIETLNTSNSTRQPNKMFILGVKKDLSKLSSIDITQELKNLINLSK